MVKNVENHESVKKQELEEIVNEIKSIFRVYWEERDENGVKLYILNPNPAIVEAIASRTENWDVSLKERLGEQYVEIVKKKPEKNRVWLNILLLILTFLSTTYVGMGFYQKNKLLGGIVFSFAILFVLGSHEMGHYFAARRWKVKTSLPYFIPAPTILGTFGAVIMQKSNCPNRKALFDIGVSGPLIGVLASIIVTYIGLKMGPVSASGTSMYVQIGTPPLFDFLAKLAGFNGKFMSPVAFAGWVGMFLTCLNMIPAGQLDGGHVLRAMIGEASNRVSRIMPFVLLGIGYIADEYYGGGAGGIWVVWSLIVLLFSLAPHPRPVDDETPIDKKRYIAGIAAFLIAALCFTPAPFRIHSG